MKKEDSKICLRLEREELETIQSVLKWVQISTRQNQEHRLLVEKVLYRIRRLMLEIET